MLQPVDVNIAYRLLATGPVIMVSSAYEGRKGVMTCAWNMPLDYNPSKVALVMSKGGNTRTLLEKSGEFVINIPGKDLLSKVMQAGSCHGNEVDKFQKFGIEEMMAEKTCSPCVKGCLGYLECRLIPEPEIADKYDLILGEVVAAYAEDQVFADGRLLCADSKSSVLHHVSGSVFVLDGELIQGK